MIESWIRNTLNLTIKRSIVFLPHKKRDYLDKTNYVKDYVILIA